MRKKFIIFICIIAGLIFVYFSGLPFYILRYGPYEGLYQSLICMESRGRSLPVEYVLPEPNSTNVPLHSLVYVKFKDSVLNTNFMLGDRVYLNDDSTNFADAQTINGVKGSLSVPNNQIRSKGDNSKNFFNLTNELLNMMFFQDNVEKIKNYTSVDSWPPNTKVTVLINRACYKTYKLDFTTAGY